MVVLPLLILAAYQQLKSQSNSSYNGLDPVDKAGTINVESCDARYDSLARRLRDTRTLLTSTLMIQGGSDFCDGPRNRKLSKYISLVHTNACSWTELATYHTARRPPS